MEKEIKSDMEYIVTLILIVGIVIANIYLFNKNIKLNETINVYESNGFGFTTKN
jgi:hypothetical protein